MVTFTRGNVVLFPFPYTNLRGRKLRPCLVLSEEIGEVILLCQITSTKINKDLFSVELLQENTLNGSLMIDGYIRANMLFTAHIHQIQKKVCEIQVEIYKQVEKKISEIITR